MTTGPDPHGLLGAIADGARAAGAAILEVYAGAFDVQLKADATPVTAADLRAHALLVRALGELTPDVPVLSEEGAEIPFADRRNWNRFWLVDPLDGTREFVNRTDEFSVNVALVEGERPVLGVVHVPVWDVTYAGMPGRGAWRREGAGAWTGIGVTAPVGRALTVVTSRSHANARTAAWLDGLTEAWDVRRVRHGSALKPCLIAEGRAHVYPRLGTTSEWDTAASQAVLEGAGGVLCAAGTDRPLVYNKADLHNPPFYAAWGPSAPHP